MWSRVCVYMQNSYDGCNLVARLNDTASLPRLLYCFPTGIKQDFVFIAPTIEVPTIEIGCVASRAGISFQLYCSLVVLLLFATYISFYTVLCINQHPI